MNVRKIVEVCGIRERENLGCRKCKYLGKTCEHICDILKVEKPSEYMETINEQELNKKVR